jgi:hypothetical protein
MFEGGFLARAPVWFRWWRRRFFFFALPIEWIHSEHLQRSSERAWVPSNWLLGLVLGPKKAREAESVGQVQLRMVEWLARASASAHAPAAKAGGYADRVCRLPWLGTIGTRWPCSRLVRCWVQTQGG